MSWISSGNKGAGCSFARHTSYLCLQRQGKRSPLHSRTHAHIGRLPRCTWLQNGISATAMCAQAAHRTHDNHHFHLPRRAHELLTQAVALVDKVVRVACCCRISDPRKFAILSQRTAFEQLLGYLNIQYQISVVQWYCESAQLGCKGHSTQNTPCLIVLRRRGIRCGIRPYRTCDSSSSSSCGLPGIMGSVKPPGP